MALDWPAFGDALWKVSDQLGIRPEWQLPVLALESGFNPAIMNPGGCVGLNQFCPGTYERYVHVPVSEYQTWSASKQLSGPVFEYWRNALKFGQIRSATRLMLSQLGQVLLKTDPALGSVVYQSPSCEYCGNAGLDAGCRRRTSDCTHCCAPKCKSSFVTGCKGYITVQDLANSMAIQVRTSAVQTALAQAYAMRPGDRPRDPVYGDDYPPGFSRITPPASPPSGAPAVLGAAFLAFVAVVLADEARARFA